MTMTIMLCIVLFAALGYLIGYFSGVSAMEEVSREYIRDIEQEAERIRTERKTKYEMNHPKAEG